MASIGIDLGTTYSCVAFMRKGKAEIIPNDLGGRTTPSVVAFTDQERIVGDGAKHQMAKYPKSTIYDAKRLMGRKFSESAVQADMKHWPFAVVNVSGKPKIKVKFKGEDISFHPEQIGAAVLEKMKSIAEDYIGEKVFSAVITVPAYFSDAQRRATKDAADIAGLHVLGMLNEPTAAAIAYGLERKTSGDRKVLIFDLGGGTFDVTIMEIKEDNIYNVKATGGDSHLGGQDFNSRLYNHCLAEFSRKNKVDFTVNERAKQRLREECEKTKRLLSSARRANMRLDSLYNDIDLDMDISRAGFEQLCEDLFRGTIETVEKVLADAKLRKDEIDDVVLVGGSTRIPFLQENLIEYFGEGKICKTINPDEAVAAGAAARAAFLSGDVTAQMEDMKLHDVIPLSLGIETRGKIMTFVIRKNTRIPAEECKTIVTSRDEQVSIEYPVFEGERSITTQNNLLGSFTLSGLPPLPAGEAKTEVCFNIDANGVLSVSAKDMSNTKNKADVKITWDKGRFSKKDLEEMYEEARKFRKEDEKKRQTVIARNDLEALVNKARRIVRQSEHGSDSQRYSLSNKCKFMTKWLDENPKATKSDISAKHSELEAAIHETEGRGGHGAEQ